MHVDLIMSFNQTTTITYTNHRGETTTRQITPYRLIFGKNKWHPTPQWLLEALDVGKEEVRTFALSGIKTTMEVADRGIVGECGNV